MPEVEIIKKSSEKKAIKNKSIVAKTKVGKEKPAKAATKKVVEVKVDPKTIKKAAVKKSAKSKEIATIEVAPEKATKAIVKVKKGIAAKQQLSKITLQLRFTTQYGQQLLVTGNHELFGNGDIGKALPLQYFNEEFWYANIDVTNVELKDELFTYNYILKSLVQV